MATIDNSTDSASKLSLPKTLSLITGSMAATGAVCGSVWYLLSPRLDQYIDARISQKRETVATLQSSGSKSTESTTSDIDLTVLKGRIDSLSNELTKTLSDLSRMQNQVAGLAGAVADIRAAYSYSFRFKGSQILDQRWPPNRIYFYAKPDYAVEMDIYLATRKFPVILKVDGVAMRPVIRDSQQGIQLTGRLTYTSLTEVTPAKVDTSPTDISPSSIEEPRPANMHYIEFLPGNVAFQFSNDDDFDISGILRVWRPITATKNEN